MLEHVDQGLDIAAYAPEFADGLDGGGSLSPGAALKRWRALPARASVAAIAFA